MIQKSCKNNQIPLCPTDSVHVWQREARCRGHSTDHGTHLRCQLSTLTRCKLDHSGVREKKVLIQDSFNVSDEENLSTTPDTVFLVVCDPSMNEL